ncbi:MAG TPA: hypothetical protein PLQ74_10340 [Pseudomonadota bacterium]|nr:hypothetical protein [Xanthomonadales bacterium]HQW82254.1 hypothetical protein [Pseudomonadota bacterium]
MLLRSLLLSFVLLSTTLMPASVHADETAVRAELVAQWRKMFDARDLAFSAVVNTTDKKGRVTHSEMRVNWPNKFHMKSTESEFIIIGDHTWMKPKDGGWMKFPMSMKKVIDQFTPEVMKASMDGMTNVRYVGDEDVNGIACKVYSYDFDVKVMGFRSQGSSTIYSNSDSGYPVRVITDGEAMGQRSNTVVDYTYDPNIRVAAPN